jgi:hypothetical protein
MARGRLLLRGCCWKTALRGKADGRRSMLYIWVGCRGLVGVGVWPKGGRDGRPRTTRRGPGRTERGQGRTGLFLVVVVSALSTPRDSLLSEKG